MIVPKNLALVDVLAGEFVMAQSEPFWTVALERALRVRTDMRTIVHVLGALVYVQAGHFVFGQFESGFAGTPRTAQ
jgi:hypothetical protein